MSPLIWAYSEPALRLSNKMEIGTHVRLYTSTPSTSVQFIHLTLLRIKSKKYPSFHPASAENVQLLGLKAAKENEVPRVLNALRKC